MSIFGNEYAMKEISFKSRDVYCYEDIDDAYKFVGAKVYGLDHDEDFAPHGIYAQGQFVLDSIDRHAPPYEGRYVLKLPNGQLQHYKKIVPGNRASEYNGD